MLARAAQGASEGDWLVADMQTGGRGRMGRTWESPPGNLYASGLVWLRPGDPPPATLALVAGIAAHEALALWAVGLVLKWPNDVLAFLPGTGRRTAQRVGEGAVGIGETRVATHAPFAEFAGSPLRSGEDLKISGILLERAGDAVVVGVGANLAHNPDLPDRLATSLAALGTAAPEPVAAVEALAEIFARWLAMWRSDGLPTIRAAWLARAHATGTALSATLPGGSHIEGLFDGLTEDCALRLRLADGAVRVIHAGDVFLI